jgi:hypothetical protein
MSTGRRLWRPRWVRVECHRRADYYSIKNLHYQIMKVVLELQGCYRSVGRVVLDPHSSQYLENCRLSVMVPDFISL